MSSRIANVIGGIGRTLITFGLLTLAFAAFQLWGTGLQEAQAQKSLTSDFDDRLAEVEALRSDLGIPTTTSTSSPSTTSQDPVLEEDTTSTTHRTSGDTDNPVIESDAGESGAGESGAGESGAGESGAGGIEIDPVLEALLATDHGEVLGNIEIPSIELERKIVEGVSRDDLRKGPGHYPTSPLPGQEGNAAVAGHRTTYGEPFADLDLLLPGDDIYVTTLQGTFHYKVMTHEDADGNELGHFIVTPYQVEILDDFGDNRLTLTACHPKYSARQRIVVTAILVEEPAPTTATTLPPDQAEEVDLAGESGLDTTDSSQDVALDEGNIIQDEANVLDESLGWNFDERKPTILWGLAAAAVFFIAFLAAKTWRRWTSYALAAPPFLITLFLCFTHLDRFLPAL